MPSKPKPTPKPSGGTPKTKGESGSKKKIVGLRE